MAISPEQVAHVRELLAEGWTLRDVAWKAGVSRATVGAIRRGSWCPKGVPDTHTPQREQLHLASQRPSIHPVIDGERCPTCGGMVVMPCVLCAARQHHPTTAERRALNAAPESDMLRSLGNGGHRKYPTSGKSF